MNEYGTSDDVKDSFDDLQQRVKTINSLVSSSISNEERAVSVKCIYCNSAVASLSMYKVPCYSPGGGGTPYNGLYGEAPPERGTFLRLQVYKRVGILQV